MGKRLGTILCALALCAAMPRPAAAIYMTGKELLRTCAGDTQKEVSLCLGYVAGMIDYHILMQSLGTAPTVEFCLPETVTMEQAAFVVLAYLKKRPMNDEFIAAPAVALALTERFPCVRKKK